MGFKVIGSTSGNVAEVDSENNLFVTLPQNNTLNVGLAAVAALTADGVAAGSSARVVRYADASYNRRLRIGMDSPLFFDQFDYAAQNSAIYQFPVTTMTITFAGGYVILNGGSSVASAAVARIATYKFFGLLNGGGLRLEFDAFWTQTPQTGNVIEMGWGLASGTTAPTDGVFFRLTSTGTFEGVVNNNGSETTVSISTIPSTGSDHRFEIHIEQEQVMFFIDGSLYGTIATPAGANGPADATWQPITMRNYNSSATSLAQQLKIGEIRLYSRDANTQRPWSLVQAGLGGHGSQGQAGQTMGTTALFSNSLAVGGGAAMTNTAASLGSGLGGQFACQPTLAAATDGIVSSYQVPAGSATSPGKSLIVKGVSISGVVTAAFTGGPVIYIFSVAYGSTAVSLATAEGAATKAPRRIPVGIGQFVVTAAVGAQMTPNIITIEFMNEIVVHPGEFIQLVAKNAGTVTSAGVVALIVNFDSYFE